MRIGFLLFEGFQALDITGPMDALDSANQWLAQQGKRPLFELTTVSLNKKRVVGESGLTLWADELYADAERCDWLVIPGGRGAREVIQHPSSMTWIRTACQRSKRVVSICTGAYILAATGLIDGLRCCSHWRFISDLNQRFPAVTFDADALFVSEKKYHSSGGLTAGIDLTLWLIEQQLGTPAAQAVARDLVVYLRRSGNQSQFSSPLSLQSVDSRIAELQHWIMQNISVPITVEEMAEHMAMSPRHFRRVFRELMNQSPKEYLESVRLEHARDLLLSSVMQVEDIAFQSGFSQGDVFRRGFKKRYGLSPGEYRQRFR